MNYYRVIPRDFFNESKLLKCLGKFELCVNHTGTPDHLPIKTEFDDSSFDIQQNPSDGSLFVGNYKAYLNGEEIVLYTPYNNKSNWPLIGLYKGEEYYIFDEDGNFMPNFGVKNEN